MIQRAGDVTEDVHWVPGGAHPNDLPLADRGRIFAVAAPEGGSLGAHLAIGVVPPHHADLYPDSTFSDLVPPSLRGRWIASDRLLIDALDQLSLLGLEMLPLVNLEGRTLGAITRRGILAGLASHNAILLERRRRLEAWTESLDVLLGTPAPDEIATEFGLVQQGIELLVSLVGARYGAMRVLAEDGTQQHFVHSGASQEEASATGAPPVEMGPLDAVLMDGTFVDLDDMSSDPRFEESVPGHPPRRSAVPVLRARTAHADIYLCDTLNGGPFDGEDRALLLMLTRRLGAVLAATRARLGRDRALDAQLWSERRLQEAQQEAGLASWEIDLHSGEFRQSGMAEVAGMVPSLDGTFDDHLQVVHPEDRERLMAAIQGAIEARRPFALDHRIVRPDGTGRDIHSRISIIRDEAGNASRLVGTLQDVTSRKETERRLVAATGAAEAADRVKSEFLANVSHEFRTPLNAILGMSQLALETDLTPEQRAYVETVNRAGRVLLSFVSDLLHICELDLGNVELTDGAFDPREVVAAVLEQLMDRATEKGLTLKLEVASEVPASVCGDAARLRLVLRQLVDNGIKFTARGDVHVRVSGTTELPETIDLHFAVSDTGPGIPADAQARIFERFVQLDGSSTRRHGGTGLGLAIVERTAATMGGRVWVESELGVGSTFHLVLRFAHPEATDLLH